MTIDPHPEVPDLVFTANAGIVNGTQFVPSHFRHPERQGETEIDAAWFDGAGLRGRPPARRSSTTRAPATRSRSRPPTARRCSCPGYSFRSDAAAITELGRLLGCPIKAVQLVDPRLYHLDLTFCPLDDRRALCAPSGWDGYGRKVIEALVPEPLWLEEDEALSFCANSVVVGTTIVMPSTPPRVGRQLEAWGFTVVESPVAEFLKPAAAAALDALNTVRPRRPARPFGDRRLGCRGLDGMAMDGRDPRPRIVGRGSRCFGALPPSCLWHRMVPGDRGVASMGHRRPGGLGEVDAQLPEPVQRLLALGDPSICTRQLVHGDLGGNVLLHDSLPPAVIDVSPYWRPTGYADAIVVADAVAWEGAGDDLVERLLRRQGEQLLLRAVLFRVAVDHQEAQAYRQRHRTARGLTVRDPHRNDLDHP